MIRILLIVTLLSSIDVFAQLNDSIYVKELSKYQEILDSKTENGETYNIVINFNGRDLKYDKWKFYYDSGNLKSEGFMSFKLLPACGNGPTRTKSTYINVKIGQWEYWQENGKKRTNLSYDEIAHTGNYRIFDYKGNLSQEGYFKNGKLINGKIYSYFTSPNYATGIDVIKNGKLVERKWK